MRPFALVQVASLLAALALPVGAQQSTSGTAPRATAALPVVPGARVKVGLGASNEKYVLVLTGDGAH